MLRTVCIAHDPVDIMYVIMLHVHVIILQRHVIILYVYVVIKIRYDRPTEPSNKCEGPLNNEFKRVSRIFLVVR